MAQLIETTLWESAQAPTNGTIPDVKVLGQRSKNKRFYTAEAMKGAVALYEGKAVYISHAGEKVKHRPATERYGRLRNVRFDEQRKELRGDLVYLESQAQMTAMIKEDLERKLNFFGLSHDADGQFQIKEGLKVITSIDRVNSVDVVSDPATCTSLLEQADAPVVETDEFTSAVLAVLGDGTLDPTAKKAKLLELSAPVKEQTDAPQEQTEIQRLTEQLATLTKQVAELKPRKYIVPGTTTQLTEQTQSAPVDGPPKDKAALKKWLTR